VGGGVAVVRTAGSEDPDTKKAQLCPTDFLASTSKISHQQYFRQRMSFADD
jgi:hypothetical protein